MAAWKVFRWCFKNGEKKWGIFFPIWGESYNKQGEMNSPATSCRRHGSGCCARHLQVFPWMFSWRSLQPHVAPSQKEPSTWHTPPALPSSELQADRKGRVSRRRQEARRYKVPALASSPETFSTSSRDEKWNKAEAARIPLENSRQRTSSMHRSSNFRRYK